MKRMLVFPVFLWALVSAAQTGRAVPASAQEFPAVLMQNVEAGKTAVGTVVNARLMIGTLAGGMVIPEGAVLSGVVEQSLAREGKVPTLLKIHMTKAAWKDHAIALSLYLSDQFYPARTGPSPEASDFDASKSRMRGVEVQSRNIVGRGGVTAVTVVVNTPPKAVIEDTTQGGKTENRAGATLGFAGRVKLKGLAAVPDSTGGLAVISDSKKLKLDRATCYSFQGVAPVPEPDSHALK